MLELNKVMLIGNLTRDPELSYLSSGTALAKLSLAVNRRYRDRNGENKEDTAFVDIDTWSKTAEFCAKYLKKGRRIFVEGRLKQDRWEAPDGSKRNKLSVTAERVQFADSRAGGDEGGGGSYDAGGDAGDMSQPAMSSRAGSSVGSRRSADVPPPEDFPDDSHGTADDLPF